MISLSDSQLTIVQRAAHDLPVEKRWVFLERCGAMFAQRGNFGDAVVADVVSLALAGLVDEPIERRS